MSQLLDKDGKPLTPAMQDAKTAALTAAERVEFMNTMANQIGAVVIETVDGDWPLALSTMSAAMTSTFVQTCRAAGLNPADRMVDLFVDLKTLIEVFSIAFPATPLLEEPANDE